MNTQKNLGFNFFLTLPLFLISLYLIIFLYNFIHLFDWVLFKKLFFSGATFFSLISFIFLFLNYTNFTIINDFQNLCISLTNNTQLNSTGMFINFYNKFYFFILNILDWMKKKIFLIICDTPILVLICVLVAVALMTLIERLIMGSIQRRSAPIKVGPSGILQPFADALKLAIKEPFKPKNANVYMFVFAPIITLILSLILWSFVPFDNSVLATNPSIGFLFILGISGLNVFTIFTAGWSSNSKFAFLGALRSVAQMVAYELCLGTIVVTMCFSTGSYSLNEFAIKQEEQLFFWPYFALLYLFFISALAETNRHPFDLPEAEAELVSGYNVEYGGMRFALFFLAEYANILFISGLTVILFLGGWQPLFETFLFDWIPPACWFSVKLVFIVFCFVLVRAAFPRFRYDQLMTLVWKRLLPISFAFFVLFVTISIIIGSVPPFI